MLAFFITERIHIFGGTISNFNYEYSRNQCIFCSYQILYFFFFNKKVILKKIFNFIIREFHCYGTDSNTLTMLLA